MGAESTGSTSADARAVRTAHARYRTRLLRPQVPENQPLVLSRLQAIRLLAPVNGRGHQSAVARFYDRRDNSARMSLLGLAIVLVGAVIALWWTTGVQVDLSLLRGPAAFLNYRDIDRPTIRPGAVSAAPGSTVAREVHAAVARPPQNSVSVPTVVVPASADERMRVAHTMDSASFCATQPDWMRASRGACPTARS
jgi:hypothetical protein